MPIHIHQQTECRAPVDHVFAYVADYRNVPQWLYGISKFQPTTEVTYGLGSVFEGSMNLGTTLHSTVEVTSFDEGSSFTFESVKGFRNWSTWSFEAIDAATTRVTADVYYELPGGLAGKAIGKVIEPFVKIAVKASSSSLVKHAQEPRTP